MKRRLSFLLVVIILTTLLISDSSFAKSKYDKELQQSILKCKKLFNISNDYDEFDYNIDCYNDEVYFYLNWNDSKDKLGSIRVTILSDGTIIKYDRYIPDNEQEKSQFFKLDKEKCLKITKEFIKKVNPNIINKIKYIEDNKPLNPKSSQYTYHFSRIENDVVFAENYISVTVDIKNQCVTSYGLKWDENLEFPLTNGIIDKNQAWNLFKQKIGLKKAYKFKYSSDNLVPYLSYTIIDYLCGIDAKNGEKIYFRKSNGYRFEEKACQDGSNSLTPKEKKAIQDAKDIISQNDIQQKARKLLNISSEFKLKNINIYRSHKNEGQYIWNMNFSRDNDNEYNNINVSLDAKNAKLISFYKHVPYRTNKKLKCNKEQCLDIAKKFIKDINSPKFNLIEYSDMQADFEYNIKYNKLPISYRFKFIRKCDDSYVLEDGIDLVVDAINGEIIEYNDDWYNGRLPSYKKIISIDEAYDIFQKDIGLELEYVSVNDNINSTNNDNVKLCYCINFKVPLNIDAKNGELLNYDGTKYEENKINHYIDIDDSYAKQKIEILSMYDICLPGDKFSPKDKINQKDFLYLLIKTHYPYYKIEDEEKIYKCLEENGIMKKGEKNPEKFVTREEGMKYIIRALGYNNIASMSDIYKDLFKDSKKIDPKLKGYISIAYKLDIIKADDGYINPKIELSREDAADIMYNYLFN